MKMSFPKWKVNGNEGIISKSKFDGEKDAMQKKYMN
jgi:hypothetical protein